MAYYYVTIRETRDVRYRVETTDNGRVDLFRVMEEGEVVIEMPVHRIKLISMERDLSADPEED